MSSSAHPGMLCRSTTSLRNMADQSHAHADADHDRHSLASVSPPSDEAVAALRAAIVESSDDPILSTTLDGVITSWNPAATRKFGYTATEAIGRQITLIIPSERVAEDIEVLAKIAKGEKVQQLNTVRRTKDGRDVEVLVTASPIPDPTGGVIGAFK